MQSDPTLKGLPPVKPPSGKFIAQLFLAPLAIVAAIALVFFAIIWIFGDVLGGLGGARTPAQHLERLDHSNPDVRWRAAADLAQVLLRDPQLAANPTFALDLTERLRKTIDGATAGEKNLAERLQKHPHLVEPFSKLVQGERTIDDNSAEWKELKAEWKRLEPDHSYILYLSAAIGNLAIPAGAPALCELAAKDAADVDLIVALRRRRAVWALANLGNNVKRFDHLPTERQEAVLAELKEEADKPTGARATQAQGLYDYLSGRIAGRKQALGVDRALERCAEDEKDPFLRELAGFAMGFWEGTPEENQRMEKALLQLTSDPGDGNDTLAKMFHLHDDKSQDSTPITEKKGARIHYNATVALARRGSNSDYLSRLEEMLDEEEQRKNHRLQRKNGDKVADPATAQLTVLSAVKAVGEMHEKNPKRLAERPSMIPAIRKLTGSDNKLIRSEAQRVLLLLDRKE